ncbi:hypothetical protein Misp06_03898 [Microbulbifer sp. NBRC 101763]
MVSMNDTGLTEVAYLPIREVARRTGVQPVTLRAWERRYGLLTPVRTSKGHRLYSDEEVGRIETILTFLARGVSIGQVRALLERGDGIVLRAEESIETGSSWRELLDETCELLREVAEPQLRRRLDQWITGFSPQLLLECWLKPLRERLDRSPLPDRTLVLSLFWQLLHEQLIVANDIARKNLCKDNKPDKCRIFLLGPPGEEQKVFTLMFGNVLLANGIDAFVFNGQVGMGNLAAIMQKLQVDGVLCYSYRALPKHFVTRDLSTLASGLRVPLWLAGDYVEIQITELDGIMRLPFCSILPGATASIIAQLREQLK